MLFAIHQLPALSTFNPCENAVEICAMKIENTLDHVTDGCQCACRTAHFLLYNSQTN